MFSFLKKNDYFVGALIGLITPVIFYGVLYFIQLLLVRWGVWGGFNPQENIYLLSTLVNILLFRYYFVRMKYDKTGRGLLLVTIAMILAFFYLYFENPK